MAIPQTIEEKALEHILNILNDDKALSILEQQLKQGNGPELNKEELRTNPNYQKRISLFYLLAVLLHPCDQCDKNPRPRTGNKRYFEMRIYHCSENDNGTTAPSFFDPITRLCPKFYQDLTNDLNFP